MKYLKEYNQIDFDDWDVQENDTDADINIGDKVWPKSDTITSTRNFITRADDASRCIGIIDGEYVKSQTNKTHRNKKVAEIFHRKDGVKLIRFEGQWPLYVASEWTTISPN